MTHTLRMQYLIIGSKTFSTIVLEAGLFIDLLQIIQMNSIKLVLNCNTKMPLCSDGGTSNL